MSCLQFWFLPNCQLAHHLFRNHTLLLALGFKGLQVKGRPHFFPIDLKPVKLKLKVLDPKESIFAN